jgi:hypothetical protein
MGCSRAIVSDCGYYTSPRLRAVDSLTNAAFILAGVVVGVIGAINAAPILRALS